MKKLKCWKKIKAPKIDPRWSMDYKNNNHKLTILRLGNDVYAVRSSKNHEIMLNEEFEKKPKALSFAQKYMEEHDSC